MSSMYYVEVRKSDKKGRGVFALKEFKKGEIIEICPVVPLPEKLINRKRLPRILGFLEWWFFEWGKDLEEDAMILGYGMIYNHSNHPNANYQIDLKNDLVYFTANQPLKKNDEIFIDYRLPDDKEPFYFTNVPKDVKKHMENFS